MQGFGDYKPSNIVGGGKSKGPQRCYRPHPYQKVTGALTAKMCEGYCGQDAYNDMFVICFDTHDMNMNEDKSTTIISGGDDKARIPVVLCAEESVVGFDTYNQVTTGGGGKNIDIL